MFTTELKNELSNFTRGVGTHETNTFHFNKQDNGIRYETGLLSSEQRVAIENVSKLVDKYTSSGYDGTPIVKNVMSYEEFKKLFPMINFVDSRDLHMRLMNDARTLPSISILSVDVPEYYLSKFMYNITNIYKYAPNFFVKNFIDDYGGFERYQLYYYLLCFINFIETHANDNRFIGITNMDKVIQWVSIRRDPNIPYLIIGPTDNNSFDINYDSHYKSLISPTYDMRQITEYQQLIGLQVLSKDLLNLLEFLQGKPNVYDKTLDKARKYTININSSKNVLVSLDSNNNLIFDCSYINIGDVTQQHTTSIKSQNNKSLMDMDMDDLLNDESIELGSRITAKKLEYIFNHYSTICLRRLHFATDTYISNLDSYSNIYLVFEGVTCSERNIYNDYNTGTFRICGRFVKNNTGYEFITDVESISYQRTKAHVHNFRVYISPDPSSKNTLIPNDYVYSIEKSNIFNHPIVYNSNSDNESCLLTINSLNGNNLNFYTSFIIRGNCIQQLSDIRYPSQLNDFEFDDNYNIYSKTEVVGITQQTNDAGNTLHKFLLNDRMSWNSFHNNVDTILADGSENVYGYYKYYDEVVSSNVVFNKNMRLNIKIHNNTLVNLQYTRMPSFRWSSSRNDGSKYELYTDNTIIMLYVPGKKTSCVGVYKNPLLIFSKLCDFSSHIGISSYIDITPIDGAINIDDIDYETKDGNTGYTKCRLDTFIITSSDGCEFIFDTIDNKIIKNTFVGNPSYSSYHFLPGVNLHAFKFNDAGDMLCYVETYNLIFLKSYLNGAGLIATKYDGDWYLKQIFYDTISYSSTPNLSKSNAYKIFISNTNLNTEYINEDIFINSVLHTPILSPEMFKDMSADDSPFKVNDDNKFLNNPYLHDGEYDIYQIINGKIVKYKWANIDKSTSTITTDKGVIKGIPLYVFDRTVMSYSNYIDSITGPIAFENNFMDYTYKITVTKGSGIVNVSIILQKDDGTTVTDYGNRNISYTNYQSMFIGPFEIDVTNHYSNNNEKPYINITGVNSDLYYFREDSNNIICYEYIPTLDYSNIPSISTLFNTRDFIQLDFDRNGYSEGTIHNCKYEQHNLSNPKLVDENGKIIFSVYSPNKMVAKQVHLQSKYIFTTMYEKLYNSPDTMSDDLRIAPRLSNTVSYTAEPITNELISINGVEKQKSINEIAVNVEKIYLVPTDNKMSLSLEFS